MYPGNLVTKHKPKKCECCGEMFIPGSGRARYCFKCRRLVECRGLEEAREKVKKLGRA